MVKKNFLALLGLLLFISSCSKSVDTVISELKKDSNMSYGDIQVLLDYCNNCEEQEEGEKLVKWGLEYGASEFIDILIKNNIINAQLLIDDNESILNYGIKNEAEYTNIKLLIEKSIGIDENTIFYLIESDSPELLEMVLKKKQYDRNLKYKNLLLTDYALTKNKTSVVRYLLENDYPISDDTIFYAVQNGDANIVQQLVDKNLDVTITDNEGESPLSIALEQKNSSIIEILLEKKQFDKNIKIDEHFLIDYCLINNISVDYLIENNFAISNKTLFNIILNPQRGYYYFLKKLLDKNVEIDEVNNEGKSLLLVAIEKDIKNIIKLLLEYKAKIDITNDAFNPFPLIEKTNDGDLLELVLKSAQNSNISVDFLRSFQKKLEKKAPEMAKQLEPYFEEDPLVLFKEGISTHDLTMVKIAFAQGITFDQEIANDNDPKDHPVLRPLSFALLPKHSNINSIKYLLDNGASPYETGPYSYELPPLIYAVKTNDMEIVKLFIENGADINSVTNIYIEDEYGNERYKKYNMSPLLAAVYEANQDVIDLLLEQGADTTIIYKYKETDYSRHDYDGEVVIKSWERDIFAIAKRYYVSID